MTGTSAISRLEAIDCAGMRVVNLTVRISEELKHTLEMDEDTRERVLIEKRALVDAVDPTLLQRLLPPANNRSKAEMIGALIGAAAGMAFFGVGAAAGAACGGAVGITIGIAYDALMK